MNLRKIIIAIILAQVFVFTAFAQDLSPSKQLDEMIIKGMEDWKVPGLAAVVVKEGEIVFQKTYGVKSILSNEPVDENTLFSMASTTKAFIAIAIGQLVDQGKLNWEDKVIQHLPDFRLSDSYITANARIKDLLTHNLGFENTDLLWVADSLSTSETLKRFQHAQKVYPLRGGFAYQNIMYVIAGQLIESVSEQHWTTFVEENILKPLDMTRTQTISSDILSQGNYTTPHIDDSDEGIITLDHIFADQVGAAGMMWSSINDISNYLSFLVNDGIFEGDTLLQSSTFHYLFKPHTVLGSPDYPTAALTNHNWNTYGLGWYQHDYRGKKLDFHTGSLSGLSAIAAVMHQEDVAVFVFANLDHAELRHAIMYKALDLFVFEDDSRDWHQEVYNLYSGIKDQRIKGLARRDSSRILNTTPSLALVEYAGNYRNEMYGNVHVMVDEELMHVSINDFLLLTASHWHYNTFITNKIPKYQVDLLIHFKLNTSGKIENLEFNGITFRKMD